MRMYITFILLLHRDYVKRQLNIPEEFKSDIIKKLKVMDVYGDFLKLEDREVKFVRTTNNIAALDDKQLTVFETAPPPPKKHKQ